MSTANQSKERILKLTLKAFEAIEKSFSIRVIEDTTDIFIGRDITEKSKPVWTIKGTEGLTLIQFILDHSKAPKKLTSAPFHSGFLDHGIIGDWSYNFGIVKQGADDRWICSITASMTDAEVKAVQELSREKHYELDDLFEEAEKYDADELLKGEDVDLKAMFDEQANKRG